ncbi:MAG: hypothetical protein E7063_00170 [Spirochaetaceae bacterium]|nr:hypothetical protein [Spirochaetaceae bacterium]
MNMYLLKSESDKIAFICTSVFWGIIIFCILFIPIKKNTEDNYETISIQLASTPKTINSKPEEKFLAKEKIQSTTAKETFIPETPVQPISQNSLPKETTVANKPQAAKTATSENTETATSQKNYQQVVKSMEELMAENAAVQKSKPQLSDVDWDAMFADENITTVSSQSETVTKNPTSTSSISGNAASSVTSDTSKQLSSSSQKEGALTKTSSSTTSALEKIGSTVFASTNSSGDVAYNVTAETQTSTGESFVKGTKIKTMDGGSRILIEPSPPTIKISAESEKLIDGSREVNITFIINPSGQVEPGSIEITPSSLLHPNIETEIKAQITKWLFQSAESSGQVRFKYNIMKK